jgi:hypothetical protein
MLSVDQQDTMGYAPLSSFVKASPMREKTSKRKTKGRYMDNYQVAGTEWVEVPSPKV